MKLVYYHPIAIANPHPFQRVVNPLISVLDRTQRQWPAYDYLNMFPMPEVQPVCPDFAAVSQARAHELVRGSGPVTILWSGGIDSTYVMTLMIELGLLDQLLQEQRLYIGLNHESIRENPEFYDDWIVPNYLACVVPADHVLQHPARYGTIITGEMADNLVGSLTMKSCVDYYNDFGIVHQPYGRAIDWMCGKLSAPEDKKTLVEFLEQTISQSPVELVTNHDLLWYLNFNFKWQAVNFRIVSHCDGQDTGRQLIQQLHHFFNTDQFQQWSMQRGHYFTGSSWRDYKMVMKDQILKVTGDREYHAHKTKYPSLPGLLRFRDTYDFIYFDNHEYHFTKTQL